MPKREESMDFTCKLTFGFEGNCLCGCIDIKCEGGGIGRRAGLRIQ